MTTRIASEIFKGPALVSEHLIIDTERTYLYNDNVPEQEPEKHCLSSESVPTHPRLPGD